MELKSKLSSKCNKGTCCFNRTFMELKFVRPVFILSLLSFNRTFMELKFILYTLLYISDMFQSYLYGIEINVGSWLRVATTCFNRTFMELK